MKPIRALEYSSRVGKDVHVALITREDVEEACKRQGFVPDECDEKYRDFEAELDATLKDKAARADVQDFLYDAVMELAGEIKERMSHV